MSGDVPQTIDHAYAACRDAILRRASFRLRAPHGHRKEEALAEVEAFACKASRKLTEQGRPVGPGGWREERVDPAEVIRAMQEQRARVVRMVSFLDTCPVPPEQGRFQPWICSADRAGTPR